MPLCNACGKDKQVVYSRLQFSVCLECLPREERERILGTGPANRSTRRASRMDRLQHAADSGTDTWEEYRGDK